MVTLQQLHDLRLGKLGTAVDHWEQMVRKLTSLAQGGDGGPNAADFAAKAQAADWKGDNAGVTKAFTTKTAQQFTDILTEARSIHAVLRDAHTALTKHQADVKAAIERWTSRNVRFDNAGGAHAVSQRLPDNSTHASASQSDVDAAASEMGRILAAADEVDRIATRALQAHAKDRYDFDESGYKSLGDADRRQGRQDADALVALARKGDGMTDAELRRFDAIMAYQRDNPAFAERFAAKLGANGTLEFWHGLADPRQSFPPDGERAKILAAVQESLSLTLASASHVDSAEMSAWKAGIIAAGDDRIGPGGPYGYHVMSSLMTKGRWDTSFLTSYGEKLVEFERSSNKRGGPHELWKSPDSVPFRLTYPHDPDAADNDPLNGFLEALGHNPEASLEFFDGYSGGDDPKGPTRVSNFDYLVGAGGDEKAMRAWPADPSGRPPGFEHLGHALEAATLGYPYDAENPAIPPARTREEIVMRDARTALMDRIVDHYATSSTIDKQDGIQNSLARMAAGHIDSLNYSVDNFGQSGRHTGRDQLFGASQNHLRDFGMLESQEFLRALAQDQSAYWTVSAAQQVYGAGVMAAHGEDLTSGRDLALHSAKMHGLLDEVRFETIGKEFAEEKDARNRELAKQAEWRSAAASAVIGAGVGVTTALIVPAGAVAAVAVPIAVESAGEAAETAVDVGMIDWLKAKEYDNTEKAVQGIAYARRAGANMAMEPVLAWAAAHEMTPTEIRALTREAHREYNAGRSLTDTDDQRGHL
ncbi:DUF6571 family protein [Streptomyces sp. enrichment culture]|uniref:DUF6571 family protein n=1 Tax=Streptomyces sp. enrichment culture TaxID=1795815 RepID=UPI003F569D98